MRITEGLLRRVIKSVIKESYEIEENVFKKKLNNNIEVVITNQGSDKSLPAAKRIKGVIYNSFRIETINHYVESLPPMDRIRLYGDNGLEVLIKKGRTFFLSGLFQIIILMFILNGKLVKIKEELFQQI